MDNEEFLKNRFDKILEEVQRQVQNAHPNFESAKANWTDRGKAWQNF